MIRIVATFFTAILLFASAGNAQVTLSDDQQVCVSDFALCTSAPCIPDPSAPGEQALCTCEVTHGANFADTTPCKLRGPRTSATVAGMEVQQIISTYAFIQAPTKPVLTCDNTVPWTDCLNAKCTIDPKNPLKAICTCPYYEAAADDAVDTFVTYGGSCNTNTCASAVWSAATVDAFIAGSDALKRFMKIAPNDDPWTMCPGTSLE